MNELSQSNHFTATNKEGHTIPAIPLELSKGFQKKRIDHRHHAMDALVIACATRDHVNLLNNQSAKSDNSRYDLQRLDAADAQAQVLAAAQRLLAREPGLDTLVLECTNLPPYADALRAATGLQVLDVVTLLQARMTALGGAGSAVVGPLRRR